MRALFVLCLAAGPATADELPTIDAEFPATLAITSPTWNVSIERMSVVIRSAPEVTFVSLGVTARREGMVTLSLDVPAGTKLVGLGTDGPDGSAWGRAMPVDHARRHQGRNGGALLAFASTSADVDHFDITVRAPASLELALYLPPLPRLAIESDASTLAVDVAGEKHAGKRRVVVDLPDIAGLAGEPQLPAVTSTVALVAAPAAATDFLEPAASSSRGVHMVRDLDKSMIKRRMKWFRPGLRQCFMQVAQWNPRVRRGGAIVSFMIEPTGQVAWAKTTESDLPEEVTACLAHQIETWEFPATDGHVLVNYPLEFQVWE